MAFIFDDWLRTLAGESKLAEPGDIPFAMRGYAWKLSIALDGDFTGFQILGRVKLYPDAAPNLAVLNVYGPVLYQGQTLWELSLPGAGDANSTSAFPPDTTGEAVQQYPMLLIMVPPAPADPYPLLGGLFTLVGAI